MQSISHAYACADKGLEDDRYYSDNGFWKALEACQVTLISLADLKTSRHHSHNPVSLNLLQGGHRRNLVIDGIKSARLRNTTFRLGSAVFKYAKPRPPCGYLDQVEGKGHAKQLGKQSGICLQVMESGEINVNDELVILSHG